jgi:hypothetical protein
MSRDNRSELPFEGHAVHEVDQCVGDFGIYEGFNDGRDEQAALNELEGGEAGGA